MGALWIPISLLAACLQIARTGLQKSLKSDLDDWSVTWVRSGFALPLAGLYLLAAEFSGFGAWERAGLWFWIYCGLSALAQVVATAMLVTLFSHRNFAVSTAFSKTEAPQIALLGFVFFGEDISALGALGVALGFCGVLLMMSKAGGANAKNAERDKSGWEKGGWELGLGAGLFFALTALFIRRAYGELGANAFGVVGADAVWDDCDADGGFGAVAAVFSARRVWAHLGGAEEMFFCGVDQRFGLGLLAGGFCAGASGVCEDLVAGGAAFGVAGGSPGVSGASGRLGVCGNGAGGRRRGCDRLCGVVVGIFLDGERYIKMRT